MKIKIDVQHHLTKTVRRSFNVNGQAYAQTIPFILEDHFPDLNLLFLDKGKLVLEDKEGSRYKVVCSKTKSYDVAPSFTKGFARSKEGVDWKTELSKVCDNVILVDISSVDEVILRFERVKDLVGNDKGVVTIE